MMGYAFGLNGFAGMDYEQVNQIRDLYMDVGFNQ